MTGPRIARGREKKAFRVLNTPGRRTHRLGRQDPQSGAGDPRQLMGGSVLVALVYHLIYRRGDMRLLPGYSPRQAAVGGCRIFSVAVC